MLSIMKTQQRQEARRLRRQGLSVREIERRLKVSKSSVSLWVRDVPLTAEQLERLRRNNGRHPRQVKAAMRKAHVARERRRTYQTEGRALARRGDTLHAAGAMLYWAEGSKNRNAARIANADPEVLRFFLRFLRTYFDVDGDRVRVTCNLFADHLERQREIEQFWLDALELPRTSLCRSIVNVYSKYSQKKRKNRLPYGTCRLCVNSTAVVQNIFGAIQEYGGFEREEWLG
jgi:transcriptional regulator with XRE-family HTH domain